MQKIKTSVLGLIVALASSVMLSAEADTLTTQRPQEVATKLLYRGPVVVRKPVLADSTNAAGKPFDLAALADGTYPNPEFTPYTTVSAGKDGVFTLKPVQTNPSEEVQTHYYALYLLPETYSKGKISVESNVGWELFLDGSSIAHGAAAEADSLDAEPVCTDVVLMPHLHTAVIKLNTSDEHTLSQDIKLRIGFTPEGEKARVRLLTSPKHYPDLTYMIYGNTLTGTAISPSGTWSILYEREYTDSENSVTKAWLYRGTKRVQELIGALATARWMPRTDALYYDAMGKYGRVLYRYMPESGLSQELARGIPEGNYYQLSPTETKLIYHIKEEGNKYKTTLDRFASPDERISGYRDRTFLSIYDLATGHVQPITFGARSTYLHDISDDDRRMLISVSTPTPTERPFSRSDFYEIDLQTFAIDTLFSDPRGISQLQYTARPNEILVVGSADAFDYIGSLLPHGSQINTYDSQLFLYNKATKQARALSKSFDRTISTVQAVPHRFEAYFTAEVGDTRPLFRIDLATGGIVRLSNKEDYIKSFEASTRSPLVTYVGQSQASADRYYTVDVRRGQETLTYDLSAIKMKDIQSGSVHDWDWTAPDGTTIQGRYYLPPNFDPSRKYPMLVYYYGGTAPVARTFEGAYSLPMYAALGYVVYSLNPSGSTGYGQEFAARHINAWGKRTAEEIIGAVKAFASTHAFVNAERIGCMGASYGGFMTQYLQTQTDIFAAACSHAGISAISSYWGEGYWGVGYSAVASMDSYPWNNPSLYTEQSPLFLADKINTPMLLIHGLSDTNVPVGESWQMFNALRILGKPVEFVGVYGEDHHILSPTKRYEWSTAIMAFFAKYLQDDPTWWADLFPETY